MAEYEDRLTRIPYPRIAGPDGSHMTHKMATEVDENGNWFAFPTIQPDATGKLVELELRAAQKKAMQEKNYKAFGKDKESAVRYGAGGYKQGTALDSDMERQRRLADLLRGGN